MGIPFISNDDLQAYLKLTANLLDEVLASIAIDSGCQAVVDYLGQELWSTETTTFNPLIRATGGDTLILPNFPIQTITSLTENDTEVDPEDILLLPDSGLIIRRDIPFLQSSNYECTYTYGYTDIPATPRIVALQVAMRIYEFAMYRQEAIAGLEATYGEGAGQLTETEQDALYIYRVVPS